MNEEVISLNGKIILSSLASSLYKMPISDFRILHTIILQ
jgi:hypothetical protein